MNGAYIVIVAVGHSIFGAQKKKEQENISMTVR